MDAIERIEVVRGPMSSLYGSDALGGVVNIITKKIGQKWTGTLSADTTIQEHRDRGDTYNGQFFTSGPLIDGVLGMKAYGSLAKRAKDDPQSSSNATGETPRIEGFTSRDGNVEFAWTPNENHDFTAGYGFDRQDRDSDSLDRNRLERENYSLSHNGRWDIGNSELKFYGEKVDNKNPGQSGTITSESNAIDGKYVLPLGMINQLVTFGGEWRHDKLKDPVNLSSGGQSTSASQYALFIEDEWRIIEPLALTTGIRMDDHQTYGDHWSPRAYLVYNATDTVTVKGGWATAFKAPSLLQLNPDWTTNSCRGSCKMCIRDRAGIDADADAGFIFHAIDDGREMLELKAEVAALAGGVFDHGGDAFGLGQRDIDRFGDARQALLLRDLLQICLLYTSGSFSLVLMAFAT